MPAISDLAPDFDLPDQHGVRHGLTELLKDGPVVLFFYPKAMTSGCTAEACSFRDHAKEFAALGARRIGISADGVDRQAEFAGKHDLDYPLLSDPDKATAKDYGVKRLGPLFNKRSTFVIDTDRRILAVIHQELKMEAHVDAALEALRGRSQPSS